MESNRRSPCGERGLKSLAIVCRLKRIVSLPVRGAWVEMRMAENGFVPVASLPVRGAWVEISVGFLSQNRVCRSPCGERGLKYPPTMCFYALPLVAPRAGSVG